MAIPSPYTARSNCPGLRLDYHECPSVDDLIFVLNDIACSGFILEKVIPYPGTGFVVLFRRHDFG